ncbi:hypothetical protein PFTANZ_05797 [Plasmodium falciparum Tanzania (2000708)]|uniref:Surface antigen n=1 Tax=Plasmodium falciparum Tanzania (2000708) TaxID=1036725 RepID=A0A024W017_PLAFA|nr:hypothetical protein PFTANZ_05797 [Plasmodium falciparum Tanzania (2000708)]
MSVDDSATPISCTDFSHVRIAPNIGLLGGPGIYGWKIATLAFVKEFAAEAGAAKGAVAGKAAGKYVIIGALKKHFHIDSLNGTPLQSFFTTTAYTDVPTIATAIDSQMNASCSALLGKAGNAPICVLHEKLNTVAVTGKQMVDQKTAITKGVIQFVGKAKGADELIATKVSSETSSRIITKGNALIEAGFNSSITSIYASIIVILIIVLIMGAAKGLAAGNAQGVNIVVSALRTLGVEDLCPELLKSIGTKILYNDVANIAKAIVTNKNIFCGLNQSPAHNAMCTTININFKLIPNVNQNYFPTRDGITRKVIDVVGKATSSADALAQETAKDVTTAITKEKTSEIAATYAIWQTTIIAAVVAIVVIVLIMVIIYLILRHRRKKKMKKKLQYIKLLEE